jgi:C_GCAxxG_C_C family probable redox protein
MSEQLSRAEFLDKVENAAATCERTVHGCGRCALSALMENFDLGDKAGKELALMGILPMSGGIAQTRNTCGALLGGLMGIGMVSFPAGLEQANMDDIRQAMKLGAQYYRKFEKEVGNTRCFDIRAVGLGRCFDTGDPDEYRKFVEAGAYDFCGGISGKAARLAAEFMLDILESQKKAQPSS